MNDWAKNEAFDIYCFVISGQRDDPDSVCAAIEKYLLQAQKRGRVAGLREAAAICKSDATEGDTDFVAFTLDRMADKLEAETP